MMGSEQTRKENQQQNMMLLLLTLECHPDYN